MNSGLFSVTQNNMSVLSGQKENVNIQESVKLGNETIINKSIIGRNSKVGDGTKISNSIILSNCEIGSNCQIMDCMILTKCKIPDKTILKGKEVGHGTT